MRFTPYVLFLPIVMLVEMIFILGMSLLLSALNVFYRDVQQIMEVVILAWFFVTPVIWDVNLLPASRVILGVEVPVQRLTYILNPMASIIATYRDILYYGRPIGWDFFLRTAHHRVDRAADRLLCLQPAQGTLCRGSLDSRCGLDSPDSR